jgi:hypothetical protein
VDAYGDAMNRFQPFLRGLGRVVAGVLALGLIIVYVLILMDGKPLEFVAGVVVLVGVLSGLGGLGFAYANTVPVSLQGGVNREARNLFHAVILLMWVVALGVSLGLIERFGQHELLLQILGFACIVGIALMLGFALLLAVSSLEYFGDALAHNTTLEAVEAKARKQGGWLGQFLGRSVTPPNDEAK